MLDSSTEALEAAVEGLWMVYAAIRASDRAVSVRPGGG